MFKKNLLILLILLFSLGLQASVINVKKGHYDSVTDVVRFPDSNIIITSSNDETIVVWDTDNNSIIKTIELYKGAITTLGISSKGKYFAAGTKNGQVFIFEYESKKMIDTFKINSSKVNALEFFTNENTFVCTSTDGTLIVYDIEQKSIIKGLSLPTAVISLAISNDKKSIAAGDDTGNIYIIQTDTFNTFRSYKINSNWVSGICFSPDDQFIASVDWDFQFGLYSLYLEKKIQSNKMPNNKPLNSISWSDDTKFIAITSSDGKIYIFDGMDLSFLYVLEGHKKAVLNSIFLKNSNYLVTVSADATIKTWDLSVNGNPKLIKSYTGY